MLLKITRTRADLTETFLALFVSRSWLWVSSSLGPALFLLAKVHGRIKQVKTLKGSYSNTTKDKTYCTHLCSISRYRNPKRKTRPDQLASQTRKNRNKRGQSFELSMCLTIFLALLLRWPTLLAIFTRKEKKQKREMFSKSYRHMRCRLRWEK